VSENSRKLVHLVPWAFLSL